jgi:hypothetical protein
MWFLNFTKNITYKYSKTKWFQNYLDLRSMENLERRILHKGKLCNICRSRKFVGVVKSVRLLNSLEFSSRRLSKKYL